MFYGEILHFVKDDIDCSKLHGCNEANKLFEETMAQIKIYRSSASRSGSDVSGDELALDYKVEV